MHAKQSAKGGDVWHLDGSFVNVGQNVLKHDCDTLHKFIVLHIEADEAVYIQHGEFFVDTKFIEILEGLVDGGAQGIWFGEEIWLQSIWVLIRPESQSVVDVSQCNDDFDETLMVGLKFQGGGNFWSDGRDDGITWRAK